MCFNPKSFIHSEGRNKHCLFSALMRNVAVAHPTFLIEAEKRQSAYFCLQNEQIILDRPNFGVKGKDVHPKKSVFQSGVSFLIPCNLPMLSALWWVLYAGRNFYSKTDLKGKISFGL